MEISMYVIQVISLLLVVVLLMKVNQQKVRADQVEKEMAGLQTGIHQEIDKLRASVESEIIQKHQTMIEETKLQTQDLNEKHAQQLQEDTREQFTQFLDHFGEELDKELAFEHEQIEKWLTYVSDLTSVENRIEALESAINKYPSAKALVMRYVEEMNPRLSHDDQLIRKSALERLNRISRMYLDNCALVNYQDALKLYHHVLNLGREFMEENYKKKVQMTEQQLDQLEKLIGRLETSTYSNNESLIQQLEEAENAIDKSFVQKNHALKRKYEQLSKRIIEALQTDPKEQRIVQYNSAAIQALKTLHSRMSREPKRYKEGRVAEIAEVLGAYDTAYFSIQTEVYYQFVYQELFTNLIPEEKPVLTERILHMTKKKVG